MVETVRTLMEAVFDDPDADAPAHAAVLVVARDGGRSRLHRLREPVTTLGRASLAAPASTASFCALVLPEEYATHKYLSRQQAEIRRLPEGAFELRNLGKNSVKVGRRAAKKDTPVPLTGGEALLFGADEQATSERAPQLAVQAYFVLPAADAPRDEFGRAKTFVPPAYSEDDFVMPELRAGNAGGGGRRDCDPYLPPQPEGSAGGAAPRRPRRRGVPRGPRALRLRARRDE